MVCCQNKHHKTCNGQYLGIVNLSSMVGVLILYSKNVLDQVIAFMVVYL